VAHQQHAVAGPVVRSRKRNRLPTASGNGTGSFRAAAERTSGSTFSTASRNATSPWCSCPLALRRPDVLQLAADGGEEGGAV